jgi:hypothetical protein
MVEFSSDHGLNGVSVMPIRVSTNAGDGLSAPLRMPGLSSPVVRKMDG